MLIEFVRGGGGGLPLENSLSKKCSGLSIDLNRTNRQNILKFLTEINFQALRREGEGHWYASQEKDLTRRNREVIE